MFDHGSVRVRTPPHGLGRIRELLDSVHQTRGWRCMGKWHDWVRTENSIKSIHFSVHCRWKITMTLAAGTPSNFTRWLCGCKPTSCVWMLQSHSSCTVLLHVTWSNLMTLQSPSASHRSPQWHQSGIWLWQWICRQVFFHMSITLLAVASTSSDKSSVPLRCFHSTQQIFSQLLCNQDWLL